ncbi:MAG: ribose transport system permease [Planctomycetota bacterium]|jgi:ribose transport system permease protein
MAWGLAKRLVGAAGPLLALLLVVGFFGVADSMQGGSGNFLSADSARLVGVQSVKVAIAALGMTLIIIAGGIDLSAGTAAAFSGCVAAYALKQGFGIHAAILFSILSGAACGLLNGTLISLLRLVPFIITLGTMTIFLGLGKMIAEDGGTLRPPNGSIPEWMQRMVTQFPEPRWIAWPLLPNFGWGVWLVVVLAILVSVLLYQTVFGRYVFAIGSSEATARLCGVAVTRTKLAIYTLAGAFIGLAGVVDLARLGKGDATAGVGMELQIIAAVVIGGGSLAGGRGSVFGTLCGVLIVRTISQGCTALGLENQVENVLLGVIIITAVAVDRLRQQRLSPSGQVSS